MFFNEFHEKLRVVLLLLTVFCISHLYGCAMQKGEEKTDEHSRLVSTLASVRSAIAQSHLEDAQVTLKRIDAKKLSDSETEQLVDVWLELAAAHREMGRFAVARVVLGTALSISRSNKTTARRQGEILQLLKDVSEQEKTESAMVMGELNLKGMTRHKASREFRQRAIKLQNKHTKTKSFSAAAKELEPLLPEAKELRKQHANELQLTMTILEELYTRFQKYDRGVAMYEEHLATLPSIKIEEVDATDPDMIELARDEIEDLSGIARMRVLQKRYADAEQSAKRSYELSKAIFGPNSQECSRRASELAAIKSLSASGTKPEQQPHR